MLEVLESYATIGAFMHVSFLNGPDMCDRALRPEPITCRQAIKWTTGLYITLRFVALFFLLM